MLKRCANGLCRLRWIKGDRSGPTSEELAEIKRLRGENRDLKEANEILKAASSRRLRLLPSFARELDPRHR